MTIAAERARTKTKTQKSLKNKNMCIIDKIKAC